MSMSSRIGGAAGGVGSLLAAADLLRRTPRLRRYVVVPILVNLVVAAVLYGTLLSLGFRLVDRLVGEVSGPLAGLAALLQVLVVILLLFGVGFLLVRFGVVLGSPWYARLSGEVEALRRGAERPAEPFSLAGAGRDLARAVGYEVRKLALLAAVGVLLLAANLVPVLGQVTGTAGGALLAAVVACLDFFDGPLERSRLSFRGKLAVIRSTAPASLGFGLVSAGLLAIPFVNLLCLPLCVAAGTIFVADRHP